MFMHGISELALSTLPCQRHDNKRMTNSLPPQEPGYNKKKPYSASALGLFQQTQQSVGRTPLTVPPLGLSYRESPAKAITGEAKRPLGNHRDSDLHAAQLFFSSAPVNNNFMVDYRLGADIEKPHAPRMVRIGLTPGSGSSDELQVQAFSYDSILNAVTEHERQFGDNPIDILVIEGIASLGRPDLHCELYFTVAMSETLRALEDLKADGRIRAFGMVADHAEYCQRALLHGHWDLFVLNHRYTLLEQWPLFNLLPACEKASTSIIVGHPFNSGILRGTNQWNFKPAPAFVEARMVNIQHICQLHEVPVEAAALQFPLAHPAVASVVTNPTTHGIDQLLEWLNLPIRDSLWEDLKLGGVLHDEAPVPSSSRVSSASH